LIILPLLEHARINLKELAMAVFAIIERSHRIGGESAPVLADKLNYYYIENELFKHVAYLAAYCSNVDNQQRKRLVSLA
jgi:hypothetical protein